MSEKSFICLNEIKKDNKNKNIFGKNRIKEAHDCGYNFKVKIDTNN